MKKFITFLIFANVCSLVLAQTNEWNGNSNTNWHTAANWSLGRVPLATDDVVVLAAPSNQPVISSNDAECLNLTINTGASLTVNSSRTLSVGGNWSNQAGVSGFNPGTGTVVFNGSSDQQIQQGLVSQTFHNVIVAKPAGTSARPHADMIFLGNFALNGGNFSAISEGNTYYYHGNVHFTGSGLFWPLGTSVFTGSDNSSFLNDGYTGQFLSFILDKTNTGDKLLLLSNLRVFGSVTTVEKGTLDLSNFMFATNTELVVKSGGKVIQGPGSTLLIREGMTIQSNGVYESLGEENNMALVYRDSGPNYKFEVNSGAAISASHTIFRNMDANGVHIKSGAHVDPEQAFRHCLFRDGEPGGVLLTINNNQDLILYGAQFPSNTWSGAYNVRKDDNSGSLLFLGVSGNFAGPDFEDDLHNLIDWSFTPINQTLNMVYVFNNQERCYEALENLTLQNFIVFNGGIATLVAGHSIRMLPGTRVDHGGRLHAWINTGLPFCDPLLLMASMLLADEDEPEILPEAFRGNRFFPNPTQGLITIEPCNQGIGDNMIIQVYNVQGEVLHQENLPAANKYILDLSGKQPGMYIVRLIRGQEMDFVKVVKQ